MNYYEHHLGDYAKDTAHLTMLEHGAYRLLLDRYYGTESAIPADQAHRICRARSRDEKAAVDAVLAEFFILSDGLWKNNRAEEEIKKFYNKKPKADEKRENDKERQRRARERRKSLFEELSGRGVHMPWNASTEDLQTALNHATLQPSHAPVTTPVTRDNTATQTPDTRHQTPSKPKSNNVDDLTTVGETASRNVAVAFSMDLIAWEKQRGKAPRISPADPRLQEWEAKGVTQQALRMAYDMAVADRDANGDTSAVNVGFLDVFLGQILNPPTKPSAIGKPLQVAPWFMTSTGIEAKALEIGIEKAPGEQFYQFRDRVYLATEVTEEMVRKAKIDAGERV